MRVGHTGHYKGVLRSEKDGGKDNLDPGQERALFIWRTTGESVCGSIKKEHAPGIKPGVGGGATRRK